MNYKLDPKHIGGMDQEATKELHDCLCAVLHTDEANQVDVQVGDVFVMSDHEELIEVVVTDVTSLSIRAMDKQGFFHEAVRWMYCTCTQTLIIKSIVAGKNKVRNGYSPSAQRNIHWDSWEDFLGPFLAQEN